MGAGGGRGGGGQRGGEGTERWPRNSERRVGIWHTSRGENLGDGVQGSERSGATVRRPAVPQLPTVPQGLHSTHLPRSCLLSKDMKGFTRGSFYVHNLYNKALLQSISLYETVCVYETEAYAECTW